MLDVKDRTIRDYEDNYLPRPKTMSVKSWMIGSPETGEQWVYDAEEVDRVIAAKDVQIASLKGEIAKIQHKMCEDVFEGIMPSEHIVCRPLQQASQRIAELKQNLVERESETKSALKAVSHWHDSYCELQKVVDLLQSKLECKEDKI